MNYAAVFGDKGRVAKQLKDVWLWTVETEENYQRLPHGKLLDAMNGIRLIAGENSRMAAYAVFMGRRMAEMHRVLKPTGSIYLHCDPTANWLLRVLLDTVFNAKNLRNEIVWLYKTGGVSKRWFGKKHDTILFYSKTTKYTFNLQQEKSYLSHKYGFSNVEIFEDEKGHYTMVSMRDVWDISALRGNQPETTGYPTQKPLNLLERIIKASSNEGDLVLDPFCGCGTAADAVAKLGRSYLGVDVSAIAVRLMEQRLVSRGGSATPTVHKLIWDDYEWEYFERRALMKRDEAEDGIPGWAWAEDKVAGLLNAVPNEKMEADGGVDARYYTERDEVIPIQDK